ncbi:hypothetical protein COZ73_03705 [Candidatus Falkowbacteria bacterium CG_4_8_14_3_um_filter_36_11]|nr:MAG: hypothetical protein COZ73_03705 [Candidatus Falkowbacteria bacterium CG_4_8_14_3_um_filter_36_11]
MNLIEEKEKLIEQLSAILDSKEKEVKKNSKIAQNMANEAEGAMISRYDTFKEEGQYLAGGLKKRHEEIKSQIMVFNKIKNTSLKVNEKVELFSIVNVEFNDGTIEQYFICPVLSGEKVNGKTIISLNTPLGKLLLGKKEGDEFVLKIQNKVREGEIVEIK